MAERRIVQTGATRGEGPRLPTVVLVEVLAYVGAAAGVAGTLLSFAGVVESDEGTTVATTLALTAALVVAGWIVGRRGVDAFERVRSVLWFAAALTWSAAVQALLATANVNAASDATPLLSAMLSTAGAFALWLPLRRSLQGIALFLGSLGVVAALLALADASGPEGGTTAVVLWLFGLAWAFLGIRALVTPRTTALVLGTITALTAPLLWMTGAAPTRGVLTGVALWVLASSVGALGAGASWAVRAVEGLAVVGVVASTLVVVVANFGGSRTAAVAALVGGVVLVVVAGVVVRSTAERPSGDIEGGRPPIPPAPPLA